MAATIKNPITVVKGGGGVSTPTTWAELKAMTATQLKTVYPEGSIIDLPCTAGVSSLSWTVVDYGKCKLENDQNEYPCVTLLCRTALASTDAYDAREREFAVEGTEPVAIDGTYYYGVSTSSGTPSAANVTPLNLNAGDPIPYETYPRIYKNSVNVSAADVVALYNGGYNNYPLSNIRQWLNADAAGSQWYEPSHPGDSRPNYYNKAGFYYSLNSEFKNVLAKAAVECVLNNVSDAGATVIVYDKVFLPSYYELRLVSSPVEGKPFSGIKYPSDRCIDYHGIDSEMPTDAGAIQYQTRTVNQGMLANIFPIANYGGKNASYPSGETASTSSEYTCPACRIILAGA